MSSWETLEDDALKQTCEAPRSLGQCKFSRFLDTLSATDRQYVESAMANKKISGRPLYRALRARGMDCKHTVFKEHRGSRCVCFIKED